MISWIIKTEVCVNLPKPKAEADNTDTVEYRRIYNGFPALWLAVFSMAWYKIQYITCNTEKVTKISHNTVNDTI